MALVRCPTHHIPYNDANPRGCPACAREKQGDGQADAIKELARVSRRSEPMPDLDFEEPTPPKDTSPEAKRRRLLFQVGLPAAGALAIVAVLTAGPRFIPSPSPAPASGNIRPFTVLPAQPLEIVFGVLGTQPPRPHPNASMVERYVYGSDITVDAINGFVYSIDLLVSNRTWRGIRVGMSEQQARGALSLLGTIDEQGAAPASSPRSIAGYQVFSSLDARPLRVISTEVRPPNGCYDVAVDLRPQALGVIPTEGTRYVAVAPDDEGLSWVVTRIQTVSRSMPGPDGPRAVC